MIGKQIGVFFLLAVGLSGCSSENTKEDKTKTDSEVDVQKKTHSEDEVALSKESDRDPNTENVFRRYDAVKKILKKWNQAISEHQLSDLENLYADDVLYYAKKMTKQAILAQKSDWLKKHASYKQELGYSEVYYNDRDTLGVEFVAQFTKICIENKKKTDVESYLYFRKFGNDWKIVRETDAITEVNVVRKKPVVNLPAGEYAYYVGQWSDTRDIPQFAHDMVPYNSSLDFTIGDEGISGVYSEYSGTARSRTYYLVKSGKVDNGILELKMIYSQFADPTPEDFDANEETETWSFKILENKELVCLSSENLTLYSKTLIQVK
ncbi:hypothetical protein [Fluviicola taffensis]|uniref:Uncharacterized protein n=1 Tax=Fluviicola taffensis (strain DSM 16823 / NCIMB 13979 / RW262) TaxID=755732 RepID=F2IJX1_FLUTR|nr:hypothetical protein [Fluviicola taffensis]AEA45030.1 hypothetical protein Fluta_3054 [Fluviicola taffensis DSM 16823]